MSNIGEIPVATIGEIIINLVRSLMALLEDRPKRRHETHVFSLAVHSVTPGFVLLPVFQVLWLRAVSFFPMSIQAISWAFEQRVDKSSDKLVLLAYANYANEIWQSYPSVTRLEKITCLNRKTILTSIHSLMSAGWMLDTGKKVGQTQSVRVFQLVSKQSQNGDSLVGSEAVPFLPPSSPVFTGEAVPKTGHRTSNRNRKGTNPPAGAVGHSEFIELWVNAFQEHFGEPYDVSMMGKDGKHLSRLLKASERSVVELIAIAKQAWDRHSEFGFGMSTSIAGYCSNLNMIVAKLATSGKHAEGSNHKENLSSKVL